MPPQHCTIPCQRKSRLLHAIPLQVIARLRFSAALHRHALALRRNTTLSITVPIGTRPCLYDPARCRSLPLQNNSVPFRHHPLRRRSLPLRRRSLPPHSSTYHYHYLSPHLTVLLIHNIAALHLAITVPRGTNPPLYITMPFRCGSGHYFTFPLQHRTRLYSAFTLLHSSFPLPPSALRCLASPLLCKEKGGSYAFPPITFPLSSSSSQTNRPLPLLRHWPRP